MDKSKIKDKSLRILALVFCFFRKKKKRINKITASNQNMRYIRARLSMQKTRLLL